MKKVVTYNLYIVLCLAGFLVPDQLIAQSAEEKAQSFFNQGAYQEALTEWYQLLEAGNTSSGLYYNIGLAASALNQPGEAMVAFEKALRISPSNKAIQIAIERERENIRDATIPVRPFFLTSWYRQIVMLFRPGVWAVLGLCVLIFIVGRFLLLLKQNPSHWSIHVRRIRYWVLAAFILLVLACLSYASLHRANEAIISMPCTFREAPSDDSPVIKLIGEGEKVVITDQIGDWHNVYLLNQDAGWIRSECLMPIRIGIK